MHIYIALFSTLFGTSKLEVNYCKISIDTAGDFNQRSTHSQNQEN